MIFRLSYRLLLTICCLIFLVWTLPASAQKWCCTPGYS